MFNNQFDPYDAIMQLDERLSRLENAHNRLAYAHEKTEQDLTFAMRSFNNLQKSHLALITKLKAQYNLQ